MSLKFSCDGVKEVLVLSLLSVVWNNDIILWLRRPAAVSKKEKCAKLQKIRVCQDLFRLGVKKLFHFLEKVEKEFRTLKRGQFSIMPELKLLQSIHFLCKGST